MKEKVSELARGCFAWEESKINITESRISQNIYADEIHTGEIRFHTVNGLPVKGLVYSDNPYVTVINPTFNASQIVIGYKVDAFNMAEREKLSGAFYIVSSAGEYVISYDFFVVSRSINSSMGEIKNIFHFTNLVQTDIKNAIKLFNSPRFVDILGDDLVLKNIYYSLVRSNDARVALDEFLIASQKKGRVELSIEEKNYDYAELSEVVHDTIVVKRKNWGYTYVNVESDSPFVEIPASLYESYDDSDIVIDFDILASKLHSGNNFAYIHVYNDDFDKVIPVRVASKTNIPSAYYHQIKKAKYELTTVYMDFRREKITSSVWVKRSLEVIDRIIGFGCTDPFYYLIKAHLFISCQKMSEAKAILEDFALRYENGTDNYPAYCYYLYSRSLYMKDREALTRVKETINEIYDSKCHDWRILWVLLYIDDENDRNESLKLIRLKEQYYMGCKSPVMYYEAAAILMRNHKLFRVMDEFEVQVFKFAIDNSMLEKNAVDYVMSLISSLYKVTPLLIRVMEKVYDMYKDDLYLEALTTVLVKNSCYKAIYKNYYLEAINRGIKVPALFESYIRCFDADDMSLLPKPVLLYFLYSSDSADEILAYVYANVHYNREEYSSAYEKYKDIIARFVYEHIKKGDVNDNYIYLYKNLLDMKQFAVGDVGEFPKIIFTHKIKCRLKNVTHVIVRHKEFTSDIAYPVKDGVAFVQCYTKDAVICLRTELGRRYVSPAYYTDEKFFDIEPYEPYIMPVVKENIFVAFYFAQKYLGSQNMGNSIGRIYLEILKNKSVSPNYKSEIAKVMIDYYYEEIDYYEALVEYVALIHDVWLYRKQKVRLLELLIAKSEYDAAFEFMRTYRVYPENGKRSARLLSDYIEHHGVDEHDQIIDNLATICAKSYRFDDNILKYLVHNFNHATLLMYDIWLEAGSRKVNRDELSERILAQCLFTGTYFKENYDVYKEYWNNRGNEVVLVAYMNYYSYKYFVKEEPINESLFGVIRSCVQNDIAVPDICKIALLSFYSKKHMLSAEDAEVAGKLIASYVSKEVYFAFYKELSDKIDMPYEIADKCFIEYRTVPGATVTIHYKYTDDPAVPYSVRNMEMMVDGVYVAAYTLFSKEFLYYYITSSENDKDYVENEKKYLRDSIDYQEYHGRFSDINDIIMSKDMGDYATMRKFYRSYRVREYVTDKVFDIIDGV